MKVFSFSLCALLAAGCSKSLVTQTGTGGFGPGGTAGGTSAGGTTGGTSGTSLECQSCLSDDDCGGSHCIQIGSDSYCLDACDSDGTCDADDSCAELSDTAGNPQEVCVPQAGDCGAASSCPAPCEGAQVCDPTTRTCVDASGSGSSSSSGSSSGNGGGTTGGTSGSATCNGLLPPNSASSACHCPSSHASDCQPNGCYAGWYCDPNAGRCQAPPSGCGGTTGNTSAGGTTGAATGVWTGSVTAQGGTVDHLFFAALGDSRPPSVDETSQYPTAIITKIYEDIAAKNPQFVAATGDYMYASYKKTAGAAQLALYAQARAAYSGVVFAAMGNHECDGYTADNCTNLQSNNYDAYVSTLLTPLGQTKPYWRFDVNGSDGGFTAKFLVLAMNDWDSTQESWLTTQLQQSTDYTFIIRHEPEDATTAPGVTPSDNVIAQYPYTLKIVGHTHEFAKAGQRQVIVGNGGAPLTGNGTYGYALIEQQPNGTLLVTQMDYSTNAAISSFSVPK